MSKCTYDPELLSQRLLLLNASNSCINEGEGGLKPRRVYVDLSNQVEEIAI